MYGDNIKQTNFCIIGVPKEKKVAQILLEKIIAESFSNLEKETEEIMAYNFPNLGKETRHPNPGSQEFQIRWAERDPHQRHIISELPKVKDERS